MLIGPSPSPGVEIALFDLEGVLVETGAARRDAVSRALREAGVDVAPDLADGPASAIGAAFAAERARRSLAGTLVLHELDETAAELAELRAERYLAERLAAGVALAEGAREAVESLGARMRLGVVTRLRRRDAAFLLELAGLEPAFAVVVSADDVRRPAPAPDGHRRALERLARRGGSPAAAVALEGSAPGLRAAREAGLHAVGVGPGAIGGEAWVPAVAGLTYDSLFALLLPAPDRDR